jgi:hypothetical protein
MTRLNSCRDFVIYISLTNKIVETGITPSAF